MRRSKALAIVPLLAFLVLWQWQYSTEVLPPANSASPICTLETAWIMLTDSDVLKQIAFTLRRLISGVILGVAMALPIAITMSVVSILRNTLQPTITVCSNIPVIVWIPFAVMVAGTDELFKVSLIAIAAFLVTVTMVFDAASKTYLPLLEAGRALRFDGLALVRHIVLPAAIPATIGAVRASIAFGWVVIFFVEYASAKAGSEGLGWRIADARAMGRIEEEFAGLLLLGIVAYAIDRVVNFGQDRTLRWMHVAKSSSTNG